MLKSFTIAEWLEIFKSIEVDSAPAWFSSLTTKINVPNCDSSPSVEHQPTFCTLGLLSSTKDEA